MNEKLTLQDIVDLLAKKAKISKKDSESFLRELFAIINDNILENEIVKVKDFGTFKPTLVNSRESVDVNTGQKIEIPAHYRLTFTPDKALKELVNKPFASFESILLSENSPLASEDDTLVHETNNDNNIKETEEEKVEIATEIIEETPINEPKQTEIESVPKKEVEIITEKEPTIEKETTETKNKTYIQPAFSYSYVSSDDDKESSDKIVLTMPVPDINPSSAPTESDLINQSLYSEEEETVKEEIQTPEISEDTEASVDDLDNQIPVFEEDVQNIVSETSETIQDTPPPPPIPFIEKEITEEKPKKQKKETISVEMPKTVTPPLRIRKADLIKDDDTVSEEIKEEKEILQATNAATSEIENDIKADNLDEYDPDFQEDLTYEDYYIRDKKTRNVSRTALIVLVAALALGILIFFFFRLFGQSDTTPNVPVYNTNSFVAADTLPILKQDSASINQFRKEDATKLPNQKNNSGQEEFDTNNELQGKKSVTLQPGETLMKLSAKYYGRKDYWVYIYTENKERIPDPDNVSVGTYLVIPQLSKYVSNPESQAAIDEAKRLSIEILNDR